MLVHNSIKSKVDTNGNFLNLNNLRLSFLHELLFQQDQTTNYLSGFNWISMSAMAEYQILLEKFESGQT